ncbi:unnamed protein product [Closterium sp. NIES-54]
MCIFPPASPLVHACGPSPLALHPAPSLFHAPTPLLAPPTVLYPLSHQCEDDVYLPNSEPHGSIEAGTLTLPCTTSPPTHSLFSMHATPLHATLPSPVSVRMTSICPPASPMAASRRVSPARQQRLQQGFKAVLLTHGGLES